MISAMLEVLKVLVPLMVGLFAGWIATRNARKTPHDNLKSLVDIAGKLDDPAQKAVIEVSVAREIRKLDRLNKSREEPFWKWLWIQATNREFNPFVGIAVISLLIAVSVSVDVYNSTVNDEGGFLTYATAGVAGLVVVMAFIAAYMSYRLSKGLDEILVKAGGLRDQVDAIRDRFKPESESTDEK